MGAEQIALRLRRRILTKLHAGSLEPAERLPSIRSLSADLDQDHRAVARAYRILENEGLVEIRPRSGVFVARRQRLGEGRILSPTAQWVMDVLVQGLSRQIPVHELPSVIAQCTTARDLTCLCVDTTEDGLDALRHEVERDLGFRTRSLLIPDTSGKGQIGAVRDALDDVDVIVTTVFVGPVVRPVAREHAIPVVEVQINAEWTATFRQALRDGPVTVVVKDPEFEDRLRATVGVEDRDDFQVDAVRDAEESLERLQVETAVFMTPAARRQLGSDAPTGDVLANAPMLSHETIRELAEIIVHRNVEAGNCADTPLDEARQRS